MPAESLIALEEARDRYRAATPGTPEKEAALHDLLEAEREHDKRLGLIPTNFVTATLLPIVLIIVLVIGAYLAIDTASGLDNFVHDSCLRGNDARAASVQNLRGDVANLRSDQRNLRADIDLLQTFPSTATKKLLEEKRQAVIDKDRAIERKKQSIAGYIAAQAPAAIHPGSVRTACQ